MRAVINDSLAKNLGICLNRKQSLYTPGALPSLSLSFHPRPGFLRRSNTKLRAVKHLGMCSLLRIHLGKRILSSVFFNNFGHSKSINHSRFCYALPQIWIMKLMLLFKCRRSGRLQELKNKWNGPADDSQEWSAYGYCCSRKLYITALLKVSSNGVSLNAACN